MSDLTKSILELEEIKKIQPDFSQIKIIDKDTCEKIQVIIFDKDKSTLKLLTTNNFPKQLQKLLLMLEEKWYKNEIYYTSIDWFNYAIGWYDQLLLQEQRFQEQERAEKQAVWKWAIAVIQQIFEKRNSIDPWEFIMQIIKLAFQTWASDLHFQSEDSGVLIRIRIDWVLQEILEFTHDDFRKYLQKIKFISWAKMNIDYIPEDGRFNFIANDKDWNEKKIDARVSFIPWIVEESTVIRFLDSTSWIKTFDELWFVGKSYDLLQKHLAKNTWIIIFSWPTWSGKTTTLYSILRYLNNWKEKIITLEDPVEYEIPWIQQSQINYNKWYTYEVWLKSVLRHDPDIILVWETRTLETAEISINAALTWHLVFTTLHTNTAIDSIYRLLNMWVKAYTLAPSLNLIVSQRLVRKVCPHCSTKREADYSESAEISESVKKINDINPVFKLDFHKQIPQIVGCDQCNGTWYIGRMVITELFEVTDEIKQMIVAGWSSIEIYGKARENWYLTMKEDWIMKVLDWLTTLDEIRRVL